LLVIHLALATSICAAGCRGCDRADESGADAGGGTLRACNPLGANGDDEAGPMPSEVLEPPALFVLTDLRFGSEDAGLDLDCVDSPSGCETDLCREGPTDGSHGVDNRLGPLAKRISSVAGSDLQAEMSQAVDSGRHPLLLSMTGATGYAEGRALAVEISFGLAAEGAAADLRSGRGAVRPDPHGPAPRPARFENVRIHDGIVTAGPSADWMPLFWTRGQIAAVPVQQAYLRFRIAARPVGVPPTRGRIEDGLIAGAMSPGHLSGSILDMDARTAKVLTRLGPFVRALVRQQTDLDVIPPGPTGVPCTRDAECLTGQSCENGRCVEPRESLDAISFAITFAAVSAVAE
jgi:hypothetical protein